MSDERAPTQSAAGPPASLAEDADRAVGRWLAALVGVRAPFAAERLWRRGQLYSVAEAWAVRAEQRTYHIVLKRHLGANRPQEQDRDYLLHEYETLLALWPAFRAAPGLAVPRPLGYSAELQALALERADGVGLHRLLRPFPLLRAARSHAAVARCGAWLATLHAATAAADPPAPMLARILAEAEDEARRCAAAGLPPELARAALAAIRAGLPAALDRAAGVGCHGDFGPGNVLATPDGITVLDFTYYHRGSAYQDLAYLMAALEWWLGPRFRPSLHRALLHGYTRHRPLDPAGLPPFRIWQMLKLAGWHPALQPGGGPRRALRRRIALLQLARFLRTRVG